MIYVSSKAYHAPRWIKYRNAGYPIISSWIDYYMPGQINDWAQFWPKILQEVVDCKVFIIYEEPGDILKGALVELGVALSNDKPVLSVGLSQSIVYHPYITRVDDLDSAMNRARK